MPTSKIVIKVKDAFFLQQETVITNPGKIVIDGNFFHDFNYGRVNELYPILKNAGNISESKFVFSNLIAQIATKDVNGKIKSLFSVEDNTNVVNLMQMANDRSKTTGENLLNYYFIEVDLTDEMKKLEELNELKINLPNLGIDYFYLRGTLANFEQESASESTDGIFVHDNAPVGIAKRNSKSFVNGFQPMPLAMKSMASTSATVSQSDFVNQNGTFDKPVTNLIPPLANVQPIHTIFNNFFISFGTNLASKDSSKPTIKVVDMEQGWFFDPPIRYPNSGFPPSLTKPILGGKVNKNAYKQHGRKTLNILLGKDNPTNNVDDMATLNGLCMGADVQVGSTHYPEGEYREAALASVLGYGYDKTTDVILGSIIKPLNLYDIVLLELQVSKTYKIASNLASFTQNPLTGSSASSYFPVEIEPAMWNVINKGIDAKYIIIEAAGNGNINLNTVYESPFSILKDLSRIDKGTGAIMVGAVDTNGLPKLNNGDRINYRCFGDDVITSATITTTVNKPFNSTSLASAITAALVANFQSMAENTSTGIGRRLTITEIIKVLNYVPTPPLPATFKELLNLKLSIY
jgi:hypothetical protein